MSVECKPILWNAHKKVYDLTMLGLMGLYIVTFVSTNLLFFPEITFETLLIRTCGTLAILMLYVILSIGPLCRLNPMFLPLLYNRRHLGVTMFLVASIHAIFSIFQFHGVGNVPALVSLFASNIHYDSFFRFPFQVLGFFALCILFLMAATSHDFWLKNLSPKVWKSLHMLVYIAYVLLVLHILLGVIQLEKSPVLVGFLGIGMIWLVTLHIISGFKEFNKINKIQKLEKEGFIEACRLNEIRENRAKVFVINEQNIAIFKYLGKVSAIHNICKHQQGPLGEGKIVSGCITCPWHGYQYLPENGRSPEPFTEKVHTYQVKIEGETVWVNPKPLPEGTPVPPAQFFEEKM